MICEAAGTSTGYRASSRAPELLRACEQIAPDRERAISGFVSTAACSLQRSESASSRAIRSRSIPPTYFDLDLDLDLDPTAVHSGTSSATPRDLCFQFPVDAQQLVLSDIALENDIDRSAPRDPTLSFHFKRSRLPWRGRRSEGGAQASGPDRQRHGTPSS